MANILSCPKHDAGTPQWHVMIKKLTGDNFETIQNAMEERGALGKSKEASTRLSNSL